MADAPRTALLLGPTGLTGSHLLRLLAGDPRWARVVSVGRREVPSAGPSHIHHIIDFERLADHADVLHADDVFCALGATIKKARTEEAFRRIDLDYPFLIANVAREQGATQYLLVSALGADLKSRIWYNRLKAEAEEAIRSVGFPSYSIFRPSLLFGDREELRPKEWVMRGALALARPALLGRLRKYRPTPGAALARVMVEQAAAHPAGVHIIEAEVILDRARALA
ncbi:MAG TPA: hypothetical protein VD962_10815 [Rubricoccaceae bacterium]|nr:hypothetical protein [Rubricoccaceae bacterium]